MPIGYWWTVAFLSWGVACALTRWRRPGSFVALPALLVSELPFIVGYLLIASTVLALTEGQLDSPGGAAGAAVALLALAGLVVVVRRELRAHPALHNAGRPRRPWGRILRAPFFPGRLSVVRVRDLAYGSGRRRTLDVYHRRDRPASAPILVHFHGGGFHSGNKAREAKPLIRYLTSRRGFVCVSANYRLQPRVTLADQVADVRSAIAWVRAHAADYCAEPGPLFVTGSSAGANLAIRAVCEGEAGIAGLICRYGYYGDLTPGGDMPPMLVVHGEKDLLIPPSAVRAFVERVRAVSSRPVSYAELPGAHHDFDMFESIRSAAVSQAVDEFTAGISASPEVLLREWPHASWRPGTAAHGRQRIDPQHRLKRVHLVHRVRGLDPFDRVRGLDLVDRVRGIAGVGTFRRLVRQCRVGPFRAVSLVRPCLAVPARSWATRGAAMTPAGTAGIQPELWIDRPAAAVAFYAAAFGARILHQVGEGENIVAQLAVGDAAFWVSPGGADGPRFSPAVIGGATGRTLLVTDDPDSMFARAVAAGATAASEMADEHGWRLGRILDPFGHEWEIGRPLGPWPAA